MQEKSTEREVESSPTWEDLEAFARQGVQRLLQRVLQEEVDSVLGRERYERRAVVDAAVGYRNGYGKPRRLSVMAGTVTVRRPRVRRAACALWCAVLVVKPHCALALPPPLRSAIRRVLPAALGVS
jgi:transposase-like protein